MKKMTNSVLSIVMLVALSGLAVAQERKDKDPPIANRIELKRSPGPIPKRGCSVTARIWNSEETWRLYPGIQVNFIKVSSDESTLCTKVTNGQSEASCVITFNTVIRAEATPTGSATLVSDEYTCGMKRRSP